MDPELITATRETAALYFKGLEDEKPFDLWSAFDKDLARELSLFITGRLYARQRLPHPIRQLITVSALTVLGRQGELKLHIEAALNVGCTPAQIAETIFQTFTYGGIPTVNGALRTLRTVLQTRGLWPPAEDTRHHANAQQPEEER